MQKSATAKKIMLAAEVLFAEQGFAETTMREITSAAKVNLAAVNYHFGSKKGLITAVAEKYLTPLVANLNSALSERLTLDADKTITAEELLEILMRTLLRVGKVKRFALPVCMRLLELIYMKNQSELRDEMINQYRGSFTCFIDLLRKDSAIMSDEEFFWRLHFLMGSIIFTLSNFQTLVALEMREFERAAEVERTLHRLIPVLVAGLHARADRTPFTRL
ncbi:TetR/AcrR family transcriptional regulator [Amphritea sp. 2_MG-2023]|uniref:TetR/AcrR family transcriptional regulator n=1 Tax=Amphritea TaxID=515417 RepID=UPI001C0655F9|nr:MULTISPECIES: TetR/AcrR family transcriptional regulator [Amphritea]MBU2966529.1 TetR family transcriptional regulator [Amphritea atlantica]MDO6417612.1 TetR/AcrR family transcriptional regulator [Amphritea sp. 2_MG-2023]MDX2422581.1 TetR/AcrR family transcriptional regulator [Amphritea sp.]